MRDYQSQALAHDPLHGYIPFTSQARAAGEVVEREVIDHAWVQRLRHIHQLQTAWYVFPAAEHSRFQHVLGVMHLASRAAAGLYPSLREACPQAPSLGYVETLLRMAGLLHDVGHGPFGHFFDAHYLSHYGLTHETLGAVIIERELGPLLAGLRRNPNSELADDERLDPRHVARLVVRPRAGDAADDPRWLTLLRGLFCGIYTLDNMDFVLRDAYMTGYSAKAFDLDRLLHYSFFSEQGVTIHDRGLPALVRFISVRAELFRSIYFHRTVRAIDLSLADLFAASREWLFPGNPLEHLAAYQRFTEWSLLVDVARWGDSGEPPQRELAPGWNDLLARRIKWQMACERSIFYAPQASEASSLFSDAGYVERALRERLPAALREMPLRVDLARHVHRPGTRGPTEGVNFLYDSASGQLRPLGSSELVRQIPLSYRICRVYTRDRAANATIAQALDGLLRPGGEDDATNM